MTNRVAGAYCRHVCGRSSRCRW